MGVSASDVLCAGYSSAPPINTHFSGESHSLSLATVVIREAMQLEKSFYSVERRDMGRKLL